MASRIYGLDAIRFFAAAVVAIGHFSFNLRPELAFAGDAGARLINFVFNLLFNGPAAVVVFFVLSGFVIHLPAARGKQFDPRTYFIRRFVRLVPPALIAAGLFVVFDMHIAPRGWNDTVFWSLICEIIYYTIYPLIVFAIARGALTMNRALAISLVAWLAMVLLNLENLSGSSVFAILNYSTWIVGFPCWLAGCVLAENVHRFTPQRPTRLVAMRVGVVGLAALLLVVRHLHPQLGVIASNIVLLTLFAVPVSLWLGFEIASHSAKTGPSRATLAMDHLGKASYSLYLVHMFAIKAFEDTSRSMANFPMYALLVAVITAGFYFGCERPFHIFARRLSARS